MNNKLNYDGVPDVKYHGSIVYAKCKVLDETGKSVITEDGFTELVDTGITIIGIKATNDDIIIFGSNGTKDTISYYNFKTDTLNIVLNSIHLNFNRDNPIIAIAYYNYKLELVCNFIDGVKANSNKIRSLNLMNLPFKVDANKELVNPTDITLVNMRPDASIPNINLSAVTNEGSLNSGGYIIFVKYVYKDFDRTDWLNTSNPITIYEDSYTKTNTNMSDYTDVNGNIEGITTNKAIRLVLQNIDPRADKIEVGVIYSNNLVKTAYINEYDINNIPQLIVIDDLTSFERTSLDYILVPTANYTKAHAITSFENRAIYGNVTSSRLEGVQKFVNNINVEWTSSKQTKYGVHESDIEPTQTHKDPIHNYNDKTFTPNEVAALYIRLYFKDGSVAGDYHIPGRAPAGSTVNERAVFIDGTPAAGQNAIDKNNTNYGYDSDFDLGGNVKKFQTRDTSSANGTMGYWENETEVYDNSEDWDIYSVDSNGNGIDSGVSLRNVNVRHHRFPSQRNLYTYGHVPNDNNSKAILGLHITQVEFPNEILDLIQGYKIMYAARTGINNLVQDESILHCIADAGIAPASSINYDMVLPNHNMDYNGIVSTSSYYSALRAKLYAGRPFNIIRNDDPILADYVVTNYLVEGTDATFSDNQTPVEDTHIAYLNFGYMALTSNVDMDNSSTNDNLRRLVNSNYLARNAKVDNVYNRNGDTWLLFELDKEWNTIGASTGTSKTGKYRNVTYMMYKTNVYASYDKQDIVRCSDFIPAGTDTINVYNGDTFIGIHGFRTTCWFPYRANGGVAYDVGNYYIYDIPAYSNSNIELRHTIQYAFYPNLNSGSMSRYDFVNQEYYKYNPTLVNKDFNIVNNLIVGKIYASDNEFIYNFLYRYIISDINTSETLINNWNSVPFDSYRDTDITKGYIVSLNASALMLYIQKRDSLYVLTINDMLNSANASNNIGVKPSTVFSALEKEVVVSDNNGYIGTKERFGNVLTKYGYCVFDSDKTLVFLVNNTQAKDITIGVKSYLKKFKEILKLSKSNPYYKSGVTLGFNDEDNILLISYSSEGCQVETNECTSPGSTRAKTFTLSYSFLSTGWIGWHPYLPAMLFNNRYNTFSIKYGFIYKHNDKTKSATYYRNELFLINDPIVFVKHDDVIDYIFNSFMNQAGQYYASDVVKIFNNFEIIADIVTVDNGDNNSYIYNRQADALVVYNDTQCSGIIDVSKRKDWFTNDGFRILNGVGYFNRLVDIVTNDKKKFIDSRFNIISSNLGKKNYFDMSNFISKFVVLRLIHKNNNKTITEKLVITNVKANSDRVDSKKNSNL